MSCVWQTNWTEGVDTVKISVSLGLTVEIDNHSYIKPFIEFRDLTVEESSMEGFDGNLESAKVSAEKAFSKLKDLVFAEVLRIVEGESLKGTAEDFGDDKSL